MGQPLRVILVHGTWGRGLFPDKNLWFRNQKPIWSASGSDFISHLDHDLKYQGYEPRFDTFDWSGANSILERDVVARRLGKHLDNLSENEPGVPQLVIGHSHGGNIILSAARHYRQSSNLIHLVTLATPFLDVMKRVEKEGDDKLEWVRQFSRMKAFKELKVYSSSLLFTISCWWLLSWLGFSWFDRANFGGTYQFFVAMASFVVVQLSFNTLAWKYEDRLERVAMFNTLPGPGGDAIQLLVLRGTDDEASLALAAGSLNALLTSRVINLLITIMGVASAFWAVLARIINQAVPGQGIMYLLQGVLILMAIFLFFSALESIWSGVFGRELLLGGAMVRIFSNSAPDSVCDLTIRTLPGNPGEIRNFYKYGDASVVEINKYRYKLRHSLYEHKDCVPSIVQWLNSKRSALMR